MESAESRRSSATLGLSHRQQTIERLRSTRYDILVIGGGVTGAGAALDAASRGLRVALIEMRDWAAGTSSRSGKLIHGGLRYLEQRNFGLVREALRERQLMLETLCPHLTRPIKFIYPLQHRIWERPYVGAGLILYDTLGGAGAVPRHRHLTRGGISKLAPAVNTSTVAGGMTFYDVQMDDARHTVELVRTAVAEGVDAASALAVIDVRKEAGRVTGVRVADLESGGEFDVSARHVINATGPWAGVVQELAGGKSSFDVQASKGVHILVPREKIDSSVSMFVRAEDSVLFVRTWGRHWLIGTTDTPWDGKLDHPAATAEDIEYLLRNLNRVLRTPLTRDDIDGVFAGLRPLVKGKPGATSKMSREHAVETVIPGFTTIVGGKYTTYRVMAEDVIDEAVGDMGPDFSGVIGPSRTKHMPLLGARGWQTGRQRIADRAVSLGLSREDADHLLGRYGMLTDEVLDLVESDPTLGEPLAESGGYLKVEAHYAASHEGALHLSDVLTRRTHTSILTPDRGLACVDEVAAIVAPVLGWDQQTTASEIEQYRARIAAEAEAEKLPSDDLAAQARNAAPDPRVKRASEIAVKRGSA